MESIWWSLELESISRDFSYKDYLSWHRIREIVGSPVSEKFYKALQDAVEDDMMETMGGIKLRENNV